MERNVVPPAMPVINRLIQTAQHFPLHEQGDVKLKKLTKSLRSAKFGRHDKGSLV